jgi:hypothetical protein
MQFVAVASQKFTVPAVAGAPLNFTVAVSVTTFPEVTIVTKLPAEVTASVVVTVGVTVSLTFTEVAEV